MQYDVFISHASEDKDAIARPLALELQKRGLRVWLDEMELKLGDSLRRSIDRGLANCTFGVVVLSPAFLAKEWPQKELDGLVAREDGSTKVVLPVWHNVCREDIVAFSPPLADKLAAPTSKGLAFVVGEVVKAVGSPSPTTDAVAEPAQPTGSAGQTIDQLVVQLIDRVADLSELGPVDVTGVQSGFIELDRITAGLQPGTLSLVAGRPLTGKTTFAMDVVRHVATHEGLPVILHSPAMSARLSAEWLVCAIGGIDQFHFRTARLTDVDWTNLSEAVDRLGKSCIYICDKPTMSVFDLQRETRQRAKLYGALGLVVVDGLQYLLGNDCDDAAEVCRELKKLAREMNCPVMVTSHLSRQAESRIDPRPILSDLEEIGELNPFTDLVIFTHRNIHSESTEMEVIIAKHRERGFLGTLLMTFDPKSWTLRSNSTLSD